PRRAGGAQEAFRVHRRRAGDGPDAGNRVRGGPQDQRALTQEDDRIPRGGQAAGAADRQGRTLRQRHPHRALPVDQQGRHRRRLHADGARTRRGEMTLAVRTQLANEDLLPVAPDRRTWNWWHIASLWIGMAICIPTYTLASGLMASGWTWQAAVGAVTLGNVVVLIPIALNSHAGTRYGIPFPVLARASFGVLGANLPALLRGLVACGWFGIQTWIGGWAIYKLIEVMWPGIATLPQLLPAFVGLNTGEFLCFMVFWAMNVWIVLRGMDSIKFLETWGSPFLLAVGAALFILAWVRAGSLSVMLQNPSIGPSAHPPVGSVCAAGAPRWAADDHPLAGGAQHRDPHDEHRRQHRRTGDRLLEPRAAQDHLQAGGDDHGCHRHSHDAVAALQRRRRLHFHVADRIR